MCLIIALQGMQNDHAAHDLKHRRIIHFIVDDNVLEICLQSTPGHLTKIDQWTRSECPHAQMPNAKAISHSETARSGSCLDTGDHDLAAQNGCCSTGSRGSQCCGIQQYRPHLTLSHKDGLN